MPLPTDSKYPAAQVAQVIVISEDWAAADRRPPPPAPKKAQLANAQPAPAQPVELTDKRIIQAVAKTIAEAPEKTSAPVHQQNAVRGEVLSADRYGAFARQVSNAKVPGCFGTDALKFQPPVIGPVVFTGLFELPFKILAAARGKCN